MPRLSDTAVPTYRRHKQSGQAIVTLSGRDFLLGGYGSPESKAEYQRRIAEWFSAGRRLVGDPGAVTLAEIAAAYLKHVKTYYLKSNEGENIALALRPMVKLYGRVPAVDVGPLAIQSVQGEMVKLGWCRGFCNRQTDRLKRMFKWAARQELIPAEAFNRIEIVGGLPKGRCSARESEPVKPVPIEHVHAIYPHVSRQVKAMIELQLLTGARPGEICMMRTADIDTTGKLWVYKPSQHKTEHHGHTREIYLGPKAQDVLRSFLKLDTQAYIFSAADAESERLERLHAQRKTPMSCGNKPGSNRKRNPQHKPGACYDTAAYRRAIARGCEAAFEMRDELRNEPANETPEAKEKRLANAAKWRADHVWHPHQLRHTAATELRKQYGLEAAQVILGHKTLSVTQIYAEKNVEAAMRIMAEVG